MYKSTKHNTLLCLISQWLSRCGCSVPVCSGKRFGAIPTRGTFFFRAVLFNDTFAIESKCPAFCRIDLICLAILSF